MTTFGDAKVGETAPVWVCPDGWDDFAWVSDPDTFEDSADEPIEVVRQEWRLVSEQKVVWTPPTTLCDNCHGEGSVENEQPEEPIFGDGWQGAAAVPCSTCDGDGQHPWAGTWQEIAND